MDFFNLRYNNITIPLNAERGSEAVREATNELSWIAETTKNAEVEVLGFRGGKSFVIAQNELKDGKLGKWR